MNDEDVAVGGQALPSGELVEIEIDREIETPLEGRALLETAGRVAERLADVSGREFYTEPLVRIGQQAERAFGNRALAGIGIGGLIFIALLRNRRKGRRADEGASPNP